jgi:hypothetical protein
MWVINTIAVIGAYVAGILTVFLGVFLGSLIRAGNRVTCPKCTKKAELIETEGLIFTECKDHGRTLIAWEK